MFDPSPDLCVADVSFISLSKVLPHVLPCIRNPAEFILLIKPQFELEPKKVPKGIVRLEEYRKEAVDRVRQAAGRLGLSEQELIESPIKGSRGNIEYLLYLRSA
jgi:23S rRNA (cytidine1920-2'-O)/16S rRNA (cytidine1409-2'-O)-methyltransferase